MSKGYFSNILKAAVLFGFSAFFISLLAGGRAELYVHPRINPFITFASVIMIVIGIALLFDTKQRGLKVSKGILFYIIPLVMAVVLPVQAADASLAPDGIAPGSNTAGKVIPAGDAGTGGKIVLDNKNYYIYLTSINYHLDDYEGREIELVSLVYRDDGYYGDNRFVAFRYLMSCCAADMVPVSVLCFYEGMPSPENNSWVKITGTIGRTELDGSEIPCIVVKEITATEPPSPEYIYPY